MICQVWLNLVNYEVIMTPEKAMQNFKESFWNLCFTSLDLLVISVFIPHTEEFKLPLLVTLECGEWGVCVCMCYIKQDYEQSDFCTQH